MNEFSLGAPHHTHTFSLSLIVIIISLHGSLVAHVLPPHNQIGELPYSLFSTGEGDLGVVELTKSNMWRVRIMQRVTINDVPTLKTT